MKVLNNENGNMLLGMLTMDSDRCGFYEEVSEGKLPKKVKDALSKLGGSGVCYEDYFRSNTSGESLHKYFKKIADRVKFEPIHHSNLIQLTDDTTLEEGFAKLSALDNILFNVSLYEFTKGDVEFVNFEFKYNFKNSDMVALNHEYLQYAEYFLGRDKASMSLDLNLVKTEAEKIKLDKRKFTIEEIQDIFHNVDIENVNWSYRLNEDIYFYGNEVF